MITSMHIVYVGACFLNVMASFSGLNGLCIYRKVTCALNGQRYLCMCASPCHIWYLENPEHHTGHRGHSRESMCLCVCVCVCGVCVWYVRACVHVCVHASYKWQWSVPHGRWLPSVVSALHTVPEGVCECLNSISSCVSS